MKIDLWLDVDGVLLDYTSALLEYVNSPYKAEDGKQYDMLDIFSTEEAKIQAMTKFANSSLFGRMSPLVSKYHLEILKMCGYSLKIITALHEGPHRMHRIENLYQEFGDVFDEVHFEGHANSSYKNKVEYIERNGSYPYILVEDNPSTPFPTEGKLYLVEQSYNIAELDMREISSKNRIDGIGSLRRRLISNLAKNGGCTL